MEFVLSYEGDLPSNAKASPKHRIRRALHPQLRELWATHPALIAMDYVLDPSAAGSVVRSASRFDFAPLVCEELSLLASVDILLLRPGRPGAVLSSRADLDNQVKTLLDALRVPGGTNEVPEAELPRADEHPFFCLLDDDKRVVDLRVRAEQLLVPPTSPSSVRALIRVETRREIATAENWALA